MRRSKSVSWLAILLTVTTACVGTAATTPSSPGPSTSLTASGASVLKLEVSDGVVSGSLSSTDGTPIGGGRVEIVAEATSGPGSVNDYVLQGVVPQGAVAADLGYRVNTECDCSGEAAMTVYEIRYLEGDDPVNRIANGDFAAEWEDWGNWGTADQLLVDSDVDGGRALRLHADPGQDAGLNSGLVSVTPGETFTATFKARVDPVSTGSGYFQVIFHDDSAEMSRERTPFEATRVDLGAVETAADGGFELAVDHDFDGPVTIRATYQGTTGHLSAEATTIYRPATQTNGPGEPDLIIVDAVVITEDESTPTAEAVAVESGKITAVGNNDEIEQLAGPNTRVVDLDGRTLLPGFIDSHAHWIGDWSLRYGRPEDAVATAARFGWTTINEMFASQANLELYSQLDESGDLPIHVNAYLPINYGNDRFGNWYLDYTPGAQLSPHVRIAGMKLFVDSGDYGEKLLTEPYADNPGYFGTGFWNQADLDEAVATADQAGFQVTAHTGGDAALDLIINALDKALDGGPNLLRHRIEHVMIARDDQIERMAALNLVASIQLTFFNSDWADEFSSNLGPERVGWVGRWRDLLDAGVPTIGGTDQPYGYGTVGPSMRAIFQAVTRIGESGAPPPDWMLSQRISVDEAIRLITIDAAWGSNEESVKGSITPGKNADFVVLSADPTTADPAALGDISILTTLVDGEVIFCEKGASGFCP
ncbi:MAG: amidohydrolase family protein [Acidimicrobiia bacterium]